MMRRTVLRLGFMLVATTCATVYAAPSTRSAGAAESKQSVATQQNAVADEVNRYRSSNGLARLPQSASLTRVARAHVADLEANYRQGGRCNMHSWSPRGNWSSCCYTPDHAQAACMWNKPKEISGGIYLSPGYEIVAHYTDPMTPATALEIWRDSTPHNAMVLNSGRWVDNTWRAMGAAMGEHYAVVWFGESADPAGY